MKKVINIRIEVDLPGINKDESVDWKDAIDQELSESLSILDRYGFRKHKFSKLDTATGGDVSTIKVRSHNKK